MPKRKQHRITNTSMLGEEDELSQNLSDLFDRTIEKVIHSAMAIPKPTASTSMSSGEAGQSSQNLTNLFDNTIERTIEKVIHSAMVIPEATAATSMGSMLLENTINDVIQNVCGVNDCMSRPDNVLPRHMVEKKKRIRHPFFLKAYDSGDVRLFMLSPFNIKCRYCYALHFLEERAMTQKKQNDEFFDCCKYGKLVMLADLIGEYPNELKQLFRSDHILHKNFMEQIRKVNSLFSVASLSCFKFKFSNAGPPIFKIYGQVYHKFNTVAQPEEGELPTNGQLYFVDNEDSLNVEKVDQSGCNKELLEIFERVLRKNYPYAAAYKSMKEVVEEYNNSAKDIGDNVPEVKLLFSLKKGYDSGRYNIPVSNEIYGIMVCNIDDEIIPANIVVHLKGTKTVTNIYPLDENVELMTYPAFYPSNSRSWNIHLKDQAGKTITLCDYVKYRLFIREESDYGKFVPHHFGKKLFQQWCVDQVTRVEWSRLNYIRQHQKIIQKCKYSGLEEFLKNKAQALKINIGKQIVLPSTFSGGPRNMYEHFMDAMTIVKKTGKPTLFITMTCNPKDPDIIKCLSEGESPTDRPEIVARVFKLKCDKLLEVIVKWELFGTVIGYCWVIEFQKRGLPHIHILISLDPIFRLNDCEMIDKCIKAEIPDQENDSILYEYVTKFMLHGPCDSNSPCWDVVKQLCKKKFPKRFREETVITENDYPLYKRPNNGRFVYRKGIKLTNEFIVPYNQFLLKMFNCHINVERVADIKAVKYLYKYIYKGYDSATIECFTTDSEKLLNYDEVSSYLDARCIGPVEACWRLLKYPLQGKSHSIERLEVHLENEQTVYIQEDYDTEAIQTKMQKNSTLTAYFKFMKANPTCKILYSDMPEYCTWSASKGEWKYRKGYQKSLGRMYSINPRETEKYYLRYLLLHVPAIGFEELKCFNDIKYQTYAQVCEAMNLTRNDDEWKSCLEEASRFKFPRGLRSLFVNILLNCNPKSPAALWELFKGDLSYDLKIRCANSSVAYAQTLYLINQKLLDCDKSLSDYKDMPQLIGNEHKISEVDIIDTVEEKQKAEKMIEIMNVDQNAIINEVIQSLNKNEQVCIYIDGPGGTGKSFTLMAINHLFRSNKKIVCNMAFSGVAATLLQGGRTIHNRFKLPLDLNKDSRSGIELNTKNANEIINTDLFIWDEAPMAPKFCLSAIDKKLKELMSDERPFGGKSIILSGDFRQILPIMKNATRSEIVDVIIKQSPLWKYFTHLHLKINMRADPSEKQFMNDLLSIGNGSANSENDYITVPDHCICANNLVDEIFSDVFRSSDFSNLPHRAILALYNSDVTKYNLECMEKFPGDYYPSYYSIDESESNKGFNVSTEILNSLKAANLPDHEIKLKTNCPVMLLRNLDVNDGLCNGTRLQVVDICKYVLRCIIISGEKAGEHCFIPRITICEEKCFPFELRRHQFPIKIGFAFTINKSQAQTFKRLGIDFCRESFAHGQTYVAISRGKSWNGIKIKLAADNNEKKIKNIVWQEVLN